MLVQTVEFRVPKPIKVSRLKITLLKTEKLPQQGPYRVSLPLCRTGRGEDLSGGLGRVLSSSPSSFLSSSSLSLSLGV